MADHTALAARPRTIAGKEVKKLRREGLVPGVVYGPAVKEPQSITVDARTFDEVYRALGSTALVDLAVDNTKHTVFIRNVQTDAIKRSVIHAEFYAPNMNQVMTAMVSVSTVGEVPKNVDGVLDYGRSDVEVRAMPEAIPHTFEVDLARLTDLDVAIHVSDLQVPEGVEILTPAEELLVKLVAPALRAEVEEEAEIEQALAEATGDMPSALSEGTEPVEE